MRPYILEVVKIHEYCTMKVGSMRRDVSKRRRRYKILKSKVVIVFGDLGGVPTSLAGKDLAFAGVLPRPAKGIGMLCRCSLIQ